MNGKRESWGVTPRIPAAVAPANQPHQRRSHHEMYSYTYRQLPSRVSKGRDGEVHVILIAHANQLDQDALIMSRTWTPHTPPRRSTLCRERFEPTEHQAPPGGASTARARVVESAPSRRDGP